MWQFQRLNVWLQGIPSGLIPFPPPCAKEEEISTDVFSCLNCAAPKPHSQLHYTVTTS